MLYREGGEDRKEDFHQIKRQRFSHYSRLMFQEGIGINRPYIHTRYECCLTITHNVLFFLTADANDTIDKQKSVN